jgi:hypothetical protein
MREGGFWISGWAGVSDEEDEEDCASAEDELWA